MALDLFEVYSDRSVTPRKAEERRTTTDFDENRAHDIVAQVLGVQVRRTDRGGKDGDGRTDLAFDLPDGLGIAEVVSTRDPRTETLAAVIARKRYTQIPGLRWLWAVTPKPSMHVKDLHAVLPRQLRQLEDLGVHQVLEPATRLFHLPPELQAVPDCFAIEPSRDHPPGYIFLEPVRGGCPGNGDQALDQIEQFLASRPDKAEKLDREAERLHQAGTVVSHRHLVVLLELFSDTSEAAFRFLLDSDDPTSLRSPTMQRGVTGLWLVPLQYFPPACPVLHWTTDSGRWALNRVVVEPQG